MGFSVFFLLNCHRMNMSIALIAMVNTSLPIHALNTSDPVISVQDKEIENQAYWSPELQGYILGSSFLGYFLTLALGGKLAERIGSKAVIINGTFIASISNIVTPFAAKFNVYFLIIVQLIRGLGQGFLQASMSVLMSSWFPRTERGFLSAFVFSGFCAGILVGGSVSGFLCDCASIGGWQSVFLIFGSFGIFVSILLFFFLYEMPEQHQSISNSELKYILGNQEMDLSSKRPCTPWKEIFSSTSTYALIYGMFGQYWAGTHFLTVHPKFLASVLNYPATQNGIFTSVPFVLQTIFALAASSLSSWLNKKNYLSVDSVRKLWNFLGCFGYSLSLVAIIAGNHDKMVTLVSSVAAISFIGFGYSGSMIVAGDMSPIFAGTLMGVSSTIAATSGFILPVIAGILINNEDSMNQWNKFYAISIAIVFSSGVVFALFGSANIQDWNSSAADSESGQKRPKIVLTQVQQCCETSVHM